MDFRAFVNAKSIELDKHVLRMTTAAGSGHPSSGLSIMHIVVTLMYDVMRFDPQDPWNAAADRLVLSEGHAVPAVYAAYADLGGVVGKSRSDARRLTVDDLKTLRETNSVLDGHPNPAEGFHFFDAATGSLGQGLSVGAGLGIAAKLNGQDKQIYVIIGDGESREGQIWEAMDLVAERKLTNVVAFFNCNGLGQADSVSKQQSPEALAKKAEAFGWHAVTLDGHDGQAIKDVLAEKRDRPLAVIARTMKGWGCSLLQGKDHHGKPLTEKELDKGIAALDGMYDQLKIDRGAASEKSTAKMPSGSASRDKAKTGAIPSFAEAMSAAGLSGAVEKNSIATRRAYGAALLALGSDPRVVALDGDVSNSTFAEIFGHKYPDRFVECKIAEQNMVSTAAGLAAAGFIPFASTFAKFVARAYDQVEMAQISRANIKIVGSHAGVSLAADGPSQMSLHDIAYFRCAGHASSDGSHAKGKPGVSFSEKGELLGNPVCVVFHPSDAIAAYHCTLLAAQHVGMCYIRTHRPEVPMLYKPDARFRIGGSHVLIEGSALAIVSAGYMVHVAKKAVEQLAAKGIKCSLVDAYSFPLDAAPVLAAAKKTNGKILCVEDNYIGGLGSAVAEAAAEHGNIRVEMMTVQRMPKSAKSPEEIMAYVGLSPEDIVATAMSMAG